VSVRTPRVAELERFMPPRQTRRLTGEVRAPLSGLLVALKVAEGDAVKVGQDLCVVEAMKMENIVVAQRSGIIKDVSIAPGDTVMTDQLLCRIVDPTPVDV
jgi:propionyl-CoA carboxylase alpha chain